MSYPSLASPPTGASVTAATSPRRQTRLSWKDPRIRPWIVAGVVAGHAQAATLTCIGFFVIDRLHLAAAGSEGPIAIVMMAGAVATLGAQWGLIPRLRLSPRSLILWGALIAATGLIGTMLSRELYGITIGFAVASWGFGFTRPGYTAGASLGVPLAEQGAVAGVITSANGISYVIAPALGISFYGLNHELPFEKSRGVHAQFRRARVTAQGTYLLSFLSLDRVVEYDQTFNEIWRYNIDKPWAALRLKSGNTLITDEKNSRTREVNLKGETVWEFNCNTDLPAGYRFTSAPQSCTRLANGNTLVVIPVVSFGITVVLQWIMLLLTSVVLGGSGQNVAAYWTQLSLGRMQLLLLYHLVAAHVLWAANDSIIPSSDGRAFAKRLGATFHHACQPPGYGHVDHDWMFDDPELFVACLEHLGLQALAGSPTAAGTTP